MKSIRFLFFLLSTTLFCHQTFSQTQKVLHLIDSMESYYISNPNLSHSFGIQAIAQAIATHDQKGEAIAYKSIAANHIIWDNPDSAIYYVNKAVPIYSHLEDTMEILYCQQIKISALQFKGENLLAIEMYKEMLKNEHVINVPNLYYRVMQNLAILYTTVDLYNSATPLFINVLKYYKSIQDTIRIINTSCDIIELYSLMNYPDGYQPALSLFDTAYQLTLETNDLQRKSILLIRVADVYLKMDSLTLAKNATEQALNIQEDLGDLYQLSAGYKMMAEIYKQEKKYNKAMDYLYRSLQLDNELELHHNICTVFERMGLILQIEKKHNQAINYFDQAIEIAKQHALGQQELDCIQARIISLAALEKYDEANAGFQEYLETYKKVKESDLNESFFWEQELQQQQEKEKMAMEQKKQRLYTIQTLLMCLFLVAACWLFFSYGKNRFTKKS